MWTLSCPLGAPEVCMLERWVFSEVDLVHASFEFPPFFLSSGRWR